LDRFIRIPILAFNLSWITSKGVLLALDFLCCSAFFNLSSKASSGVLLALDFLCCSTFFNLSSKAFSGVLLALELLFRSASVSLRLLVFLPPPRVPLQNDSTSRWYFIWVDYRWLTCEMGSPSIPIPIILTHNVLTFAAGVSFCSSVLTVPWTTFLGPDIFLWRQDCNNLAHLLFLLCFLYLYPFFLFLVVFLLPPLLSLLQLEPTLKTLWWTKNQMERGKSNERVTTDKKNRQCLSYLPVDVDTESCTIYAQLVIDDMLV